MAKNAPLYLVLLWHMHQPYYKDMRTGKYLMPWVRLHGTKDYLDMVQLQSEYPKIKANYNMVPSLMEQIDDYVNHGATDLVWDLTARPADLLNDTEKKFILERFFYAHYDNMIKPFPRFRELYEKRGWAKTENELMRAVQYFLEDDMRDLQVWYNLVWIDPLLRQKDTELLRLLDKGRHFTEQEKTYVLEKHRELLSQIVPTYRDAEARGQIEISCTPFYHPILPLVFDTNLARIARPQIALPRNRFSHPEDAQAHVRNAVRYHEKCFGVKPRGMWPAEGSVAPEILPLLTADNIKWIATDEEILAHSTGEMIRRDVKGNVLNPELLYQPYYATYQDSRMAMLFRDHFLSDLIGFQYAGWDSNDGAGDLVSRIEYVARGFQDSDRPHVMSLILDGENCWEHYRDDGLPFLRRFYELLSASKLVETTRISDYLDQYPPTRTLPRLFSGSWINHDFRIWIGHREDNQSWDYLNEVREALERHINGNLDKLTEEQIRLAWKEIYIAEGSDWNWWYGDDHSSGMDEEFDKLYREHLMTACQIVGLQPPSFLLIPIKTAGIAGLSSGPRAFIHPVIDGRNTSYYEWFAAGHYDPSLGGGSMHQAQYIIRRMYYGFDRENLYFRLDGDHSVLKPESADKVTVTLTLLTPATYRIPIVLHPSEVRGKPAVLEQEVDKKFETVAEIKDIAAGQIVEIAIPMSAINAKSGDNIYFYATLEVNDRQIERCPPHSPLHLQIPAPDFEKKMWVV